MIIHRKREYFSYDEPSNYVSSSNTPPHLFPQERDWTCVVACIRTILSGITQNIPSEDEYLNKYNLKMGPHFTDEVLEKIMLEPAKNIKTHKDYDKNTINLQTLSQLLQEKYFIMAESMYNYDHWVVVLGYYATRDKQDTEEHNVLVYDPYSDKIRLLIAEEFETMWCSPDNNRYREFIAIK